MADSKVACPICERCFHPSVINTHVNSCLSEQDEMAENAEGGPHQGDDCQPAKRQKTEDSRSRSGHLGPGQAGLGATTGLAGNAALSAHSSSQAESKRKAAWGSLAPPKNTKKAASPNEKPSITKSLSVNFALSQNSDQSPMPKGNTSSNKSSFFGSKISSPKHGQNVSESQKLTPHSKADEVEKQDQSLSQTVSAKKSCPPGVPLAERMRPRTLAEYFGQEEVLGHNKLMRSLVESHQIPSMIIWGPPGCGKTTLARIIAERCRESHNTRFVQLSATTSGIADVKEVVKIAKNQLSMFKRRTILFVDEVHRFNKLQQDSFLPHVEDGSIILIGATTENPSFQVNNALMSRCRVIVLSKLSVASLVKILERALTDLDCEVLESESDMKNGPQEREGVYIERAALTTLANLCDGDARASLNALQLTVESKVASHQMRSNSDKPLHVVVDVADVKEGLQRSHVQYDRTGEEHYNCASALQKSIRGSSDAGAIYWLTRMLEGGEDPLFIARRLVVTASEDIGLADNQALPLAVSTFQACQFLGMPECAIPLAHCTTYLARAPKSNEAYGALTAARESIHSHEGPLPSVPLHLRNAPTKLMKNLGYGKGYKYSHAGGDTDQEYLPPELREVNFFKNS